MGENTDTLDRVQLRLRRGETVNLEGVDFVHAGEWKDLQPGDFYAAERNTGPKLLTVLEVKETAGEHDEFAGFVIATEMAYPYDLWECVKVKPVEPLG